jgi:predicted GNAT family acetyltransferase
MSIRQLVPGDEDLLELFLSSHAETSMFLRSNLRVSGLLFEEKAYHGDYFGSFNAAGEIDGVIAHYWNGNVMVQAPTDSILSDLVELFHDTATRPIVGVQGATDQSVAVTSGLGLADAGYATNQEEGLYALELDDLRQPDDTGWLNYVMVSASEVDGTTLTRWLKAYQIEALGYDDTEELDKIVKSRVERTMDSSDNRILLVDDQPVCLCGINARLPDVVQIGPVWTPPEHRNRGYARTLVAWSLRQEQSQGVNNSILFTDNPAAAKAYEAIGFRLIGSYRMALLRTPVKLN